MVRILTPTLICLLTTAALAQDTAPRRSTSLLGGRWLCDLPLAARPRPYVSAVPLAAEVRQYRAEGVKITLRITEHFVRPGRPLDPALARQLRAQASSLQGPSCPSIPQQYRALTLRTPGARAVQVTPRAFGPRPVATEKDPWRARLELQHGDGTWQSIALSMTEGSAEDGATLLARLVETLRPGVPLARPHAGWALALDAHRRLRVQPGADAMLSIVQGPDFAVLRVRRVDKVPTHPLFSFYLGDHPQLQWRQGIGRRAEVEPRKTPGQLLGQPCTWVTSESRGAQRGLLSEAILRLDDPAKHTRLGAFLHCWLRSPAEQLVKNRDALARALKIETVR